MKRFLIFLVSILAALLISSCGAPGPEKVAQNFLHAYNTGDFATAKKYCTEDSAATISMAESFLGEKEIAEMQKSKPTIKIVEVKISDDKESATVKAEISEMGDDEPEKETVNLIKVDGLWKVVISK